MQRSSVVLVCAIKRFESKLLYMSSCVKAQDARSTTQRRRVMETNDVILSQASRNGSSTVLSTGTNDGKSLEVREVDSLINYLTALSLFAITAPES